MSEVMTEGRADIMRDGAVVYTTLPPLDHLADDVLVYWHDSRARTLEQIRKAWALMGEIAEYQGQGKDDVYREQSTAFSLKHLEILQGELFHLSTATVSTARTFINLLIEIIIEYGIPTKEPLYGLCDDIERYVYACLMNKKCAVCGKKADIHHCEGSTVGMGRNRKTMIHLGLELMPLCREHHGECHSMGQKAFNEKYHLQGIPADEKICKKAGLKYAD
jgi:hypothetical protein